MDKEAEIKILFQAEVIQYLKKLKELDTKELKIVFGDKERTFSDNVLTMKEFDSDRMWKEALAYRIFGPLIAQGLERFIEEVEKIAEAGEVPKRSA